MRDNFPIAYVGVISWIVMEVDQDRPNKIPVRYDDLLPRSIFGWVSKIKLRMSKYVFGWVTKVKQFLLSSVYNVLYRGYVH